MRRAEPAAVTLAIGDGGNDVSMIRRAVRCYTAVVILPYTAHRCQSATATDARRAAPEGSIRPVPCERRPLHIAPAGAWLTGALLATQPL